jgi:hypothetical protein
MTRILALSIPVLVSGLVGYTIMMVVCCVVDPPVVADNVVLDTSVEFWVAFGVTSAVDMVDALLVSDMAAEVNRKR